MNHPGGFPRTVACTALFLSLTLPAFPQTKKETRQWKKCVARVEKAADPAAGIALIREFIDGHPGHFYLAAAKRRIVTLEYRRIPADADTRAFRDFIARHPESPEADLARAVVADDEDFHKALAAHSEKAVRGYLENHPGGRSAAAAQRALLGFRMPAVSADDLAARLGRHGLADKVITDHRPAPYQARRFCYGADYALGFVRFTNPRVLNVDGVVRWTSRRSVIPIRGLGEVPGDIPPGATVTTAGALARRCTFARWDPFFIFIIATTTRPEKALEALRRELLQ